jgi:hypothetical protein
VVLWPLAVDEIRSPICDVYCNLGEVKTHIATILYLQAYLMFSNIIERKGIDCEELPQRATLRHEVWWSNEVASGILLPYCHNNVIALEVKDFRSEINISLLVHGDGDDVKRLRPEYWVIIYHSDSDRHVIELISEVIESDLRCVGAHLVEA